MKSFVWKSNNFLQILAENYYLIVVGIYILAVYFPIVRPGIAMSLILISLITGLRLKTNRSEQECLVSIFMVYSILSCIGFFFNNVPFAAYFGDLTNQCLPIVFFFISYNSNFNIEIFYKKFVLSITIALLIGLYFYFYNPPVYLDFMHRTSDEYYTGTENMIQRFNSIFGSTITGSYCLFLIGMSIYPFLKQKNRNLQINIKNIIIYILAFACAMLTSQRSSMVLAIAIPIGFYLIGFFYQKKINPIFSIINIGILCLIIYLLVDVLNDYFEIFGDRLSSLDGAYGERDDQWKNNFSHHPNIIFGSGLGSAGHKSIGFNPYPICDGALFKYISELGVLGILLFLFIIIRGTIYKIKYIPTLFREYVVVGCVLIQSTGSNTLAFQMILPLFWFCLGVISNYHNIYKYGNYSLLSSPIPSNSR